MVSKYIVYEMYFCLENPSEITLIEITGGTAPALEDAYGSGHPMQ